MRRQATVVGILAMSLCALAASAAGSAELQSKRHTFTGKASFYSESTRVASGAKFDPNKLAAAHRTLPLGTHVRVTDPRSGRSVIVTINDRGPFKKERVLDLSPAAAKILSMTDRGVIFITAEVM